jgi:hypothetical protein
VEVRLLEEIENTETTAIHSETRLHQSVLKSVEKLMVPGHLTSIEQKGNRLDFPNPLFSSGKKGVAQRKRNLCYVDAVLHSNFTPRVLIEIVDKSPVSPNGITGLTINVDRIAEVHPNIDLVFVVLAQIKDFYCCRCGVGHRLSNTRRLPCLKNALGLHPSDEAYGALIHEGKAANFKKALMDYPIKAYLKNISPPSVLFLNINEAARSWTSYEARALKLIQDEIIYVLSSGKREQTRLVAPAELMPNSTSS